MELTRLELKERRARFVALMADRCPDWDTAVFIDNVNQYYFTGTMQDGILFIYRDGSCLYGVRRSFDRAKLESPLEESALLPIVSYRDVVAARGAELGKVYIESELMSVMVLDRLRKAFVFDSPGSLDSVIRTQRSVKSPYELHWTKISGEKHRLLLEEIVPALLREGMSEAELCGEITSEMYKSGHQGIARFHQFQADVSIGQMGFGTNSLYPTRLNGPGGTKGSGAASQLSADGTRETENRMRRATV
jgi:Xaa-Pro aminopeptidase